MPDLNDVQGAVDAWFQERIRCGPIARFTPALNQADAAKDALKARLAALFDPPDAKPKPKPTPPPVDAAAQPAPKE